MTRRAGYGGAGGYGGISTMNQEHRQGRYRPHKNITRHILQDPEDQTQVFCFDCEQRWYHPRTEPWAPEVCARSSSSGERSEPDEG